MKSDYNTTREQHLQAIYDWYHDFCERNNKTPNDDELKSYIKKGIEQWNLIKKTKVVFNQTKLSCLYQKENQNEQQ